MNIVTYTCNTAWVIGYSATWMKPRRTKNATRRSWSLTIRQRLTSSFWENSRTERIKVASFYFWNVFGFCAFNVFQEPLSHHEIMYILLTLPSSLPSSNPVWEGRGRMVLKRITNILVCLERMHQSGTSWDVESRGNWLTKVRMAVKLMFVYVWKLLRHCLLLS